MKNVRNLLYIYSLLEILFLILFLILNIVFKLDADNVYILLLINFITIFPLPLTNVILEYRALFNKIYNQNFNEIASYYEHLLTLKEIIDKYAKEDTNQLDKAIDKVVKSTKKRIVYEEIYTIRPWINVNSKMSSLFYYTNRIYLNLILVTKKYDDITKEIKKEIELFDKTMYSIKFNKTNKKWQKEIESINSKWSDLF